MLSHLVIAVLLRATPEVWFLVTALVGFALIAWRLRERTQRQRHRELRQAMRQRTEQLERGQTLEASRNRIMEMLVSNEPLGLVLDAIAKSVNEQIPGARCVVLVQQSVAAAPGIPQDWLAALQRPGTIPFETWRQRCEYRALREEPAWQSFVTQLDAGGQGGSIPVTVRSVPIGESGKLAGAILLLYPEDSGREPWERILCVSARLAHIAIDHRRYCDELAFQARHDSLTGLPNRSMLDDRLESAITEAHDKGQRLAVIYIDVDNFKQINDRYRHRVGDAVLVEIANRLSSAVRPQDTLARIGGDEFNIVIPGMGEAAEALEYTAHLLAAFKEPVRVAGFELAVTLSMGVAVYPDDGQEAGDLQRQADAAMYLAKGSGKNRAQEFAGRAHVLDDVRMEQNLRHALNEGWFAVHYQPEFTAEYSLAGLEALIRMNHPLHGQIMPDRFISIAEATGLIVPIGAWVIDEVCRQIAEWRTRELAPVVVAVNVSAVQMARADFAESVGKCLESHAVPAHCIELEVTESMLVNADNEEHRQIQLLRAMGIAISIDDFGTGFSSLSYLHRLKVDAVKLDRSFIQTIDSDGGARHLVRAVIDVARSLGLDVIAEGVETEAQRRELMAAGCQVMQGYLFAHPGLPETIEGLLCTDLCNSKSNEGDLARLYTALEGSSVPEESPVSVRR